MKSRITMVLGLMLGGVSVLCAHDLFLKLDSYFLAPDTSVRVTVLNGTFTSTEAALAADRVTDISMVGPDGITQLDVTGWSVKGDSSFLRLKTGDPGTYVVAATDHGLRVDGALTMVGETREITVDVALDASSDTLRIAGTFSVKQTDFFIKPYSTALGTVKVADEVTFHFEVLARLSSESNRNVPVPDRGPGQHPEID